MKRWLGTILLIGVSVWPCMCQTPTLNAMQQAKTAQAERAATRFLRRFNETRDFSVVYREFFVRDKKLRLAVARKYYTDWFIDKKVLETLNDETVEQVYQTFLTAAYSGFFYTLNQKDYGSEQGEAQMVSLWLFVLSQTLSQIKDERVIKVVMQGFISCDNEKDYLLETKEQIGGYLLVNRRFVAEIKRRLPPNPAFTKAYRKNVTNIVFNGKPTYIEDGDEQLGIPKGVTNYTISRGVFRLVWIEENGQFRVVAPILDD